MQILSYHPFPNVEISRRFHNHKNKNHKIVRLSIFLIFFFFKPRYAPFRFYI